MPRIEASDLLLVVDIQPDFCPGGALSVPGGESVIGPVNALMDRFKFPDTRRCAPST